MEHISFQSVLMVLLGQLCLQSASLEVLCSTWL